MRRFILLASTLFVLLLSCQTTTDDYISPLALSDAPLEEKLEAFGGIPVDVPMPEMYFDGTEWLSRLTEEFSSAGDYILISTFLGSSSSALEPMYRALMDAAERGVDVYLLIDGVSSYDMTETSKYMTPLYFLRDSGVHLVEYAPVSAMRLMNPAALIIRDHRKLVVIDGDTAVIGGMNMNFISMGAGEGKTQRDSMYLFHSASLSDALMHEFVDIWNAASVEKLDYDDFPIAGDNGGEYRAYLFNRGSGSEASISGMYASLLGSAQSDILMFPYLPVLDKNMKAGVRAAVERGVDVTMVMPVDLRGYAASGVYYFLPELIESTGADIYTSIYDENGELLPLLHEKLVIVDSRYVVIGSSNFNYRSMELSHELALVIDSPELAARLEKHAETIKASAEHVTLEEARRLKDEEGSFFSYLFMYFGG